MSPPRRSRVAPTLGGAAPPVRNAPAQVAPQVSRQTTPQLRPMRVRVPGLVEVGPGGGRNPRFRLYDLSLAGFCFESGTGGFVPGQNLRAGIEMIVDGISITIYVTFEVRNCDADGRIGCRFDNPGPQENSVLRQLVSSRLNGHPVQASELLRAK